MFKIALFICFAFIANAGATPLLDAIDSAPIGATLKLSAGIYKGNIVIEKPITILGKEDGADIEGSLSQNVITIKSSSVKLENLKITKSGCRIDTMDAAIFVNSAQNVSIQKCVIEDSLYGIFMDNVSNSTILNNKISSNNQDMGLRGDAIRFWFSHNNIIEGN